MLNVLNIDDKNWKEFVEGHQESTVFHHPLWSNVLEKSYGYRPFVIALEDKSGQLVAGSPVVEVDSWLTGKRWVSLAFSDHCKPLAKNADDLQLLIKGLMLKTRESNIPRIEIRHEFPTVSTNTNTRSYFIHTLKLDKEPGELFKEFRKKGVQYCIKKASKSGVVVSQSYDLASLMSFYDLHLLTRKKLGVPIQPRRFFQTLWENMITNQMGFTMLACHEDKVLAGSVFLYYKKKLIYKYGATDPRYLNFYANHALLWKAIQWGCENGMQILDWGRTDKGNEGLRQFKLGWGTEEENLVYTFLGNPPDHSITGWKQKLSENAIRRSPVWVGRVLGELLYKHVG